MPKERTEEQILTKAPLVVTLGSKSYQLPILTVIPMQEWRKKVIEAATEIGSLGVSLSGLGTAFIAFPEKIAALVFDYAQKLPKDEILDLENGATEEQFSLAFSEIVSVAFPCLRQLSMMKLLLTAQNPSASEKPTNSFSPSTASRQIM